MQPGSGDRLQTLFFGALDLPHAERSAYLRHEAGSAELEAEVAAMLVAHEAATTDGTGAHTRSADRPANRPRDRVGERLGAYRLVEHVGSGGMGEVYRAVRDDDQYKQEVAVKLVRSSLAGDELSRRFRVERQVLARLEHSNIARLLDGGVAPDGSPYLVMQFVRGEPITRYADTRSLGVADRLRLFETVCRTVQYAHTNLVVHRDLKPSNILVTDDGQVQLLDFGIAKLLDPEGAGVTVPLTEELVLLTPEHAAPEQILGGAITTATDTYGLGVLLYEILTGTRPFRATSGISVSRAVCEVDPTLPSRVVESSQIDGMRQTLRGDLDQIVMMALRKEPERRYATAGELADDVDRYLRGRPVRAQRDTRGYRVRKFVRRNPVALGALAAFVALLTSSVVVVAVQSQARARALVEAQRERDVSTRLADFMVSVFDANDPTQTRGRTVTARELLDDAAARLEVDLAGQPEVQADLALAMGRAYSGLGLAGVAADLFERAVTIRRAETSDDDAALIEAVADLARARAGIAEHKEAVRLMDEAIGLAEAHFGPNNPELARMLSDAGRMRVETGQWDEAEELLERAEYIQRHQEPVDARALAKTLQRRVVVLEGLGGPPEEWLALTTEALEALDLQVALDDPVRLDALDGHALALRGNGMGDSAITIHERVLESRRAMYGPDHPVVALSQYNLGRAIGQSAGRWAESMPYLEEALATRERLLGPDHREVASVLHSLAFAKAMTGELAEAAELERRSGRIYEATSGPEHLDTFASMALLAQLESLLGNHESALSLLERLVERGWTGFEILGNQPFDGIRDDPRFQRLLEAAGVG